jgi:hypothetical protein
LKITADTNVLVRAVVSDDPAQSQAAITALGGAEQIAVALPSLYEFVWVLRRVYAFPVAEISAAIQALTAASPKTSARIASVESTSADGSPGAVSRGARVLARVVLPLAGGPFSRWKRSGAAVAEGKEVGLQDDSSLSQVNRSRQGLSC